MTAFFNDWYCVDPQWESAPKCKHGSKDCEKCGTSYKRDASHSTIGGQGAVARIGRAPSKKRKGKR